MALRNTEHKQQCGAGGEAARTVAYSITTPPRNV